MSEPKAHHIVSKFYLQGFLSLGARTKLKKLWIYRRGISHPIQGSPRRTARMLHYNSVVTIDGVQDATAEKLLNIIESPTSQIWHRLQDQRTVLTDEERMIISEFIALRAARVPSVREAINEMVDEDIRATMEWQAAHFDDLAEGKRQAYGLTTRADLDEVIAESRKGRFGLDQNAHIESMIHALPELAELIYRMKWKFLHAPGERVFITSDNPVIRMNPNYPSDLKGQDGLGLPGVQVTFPVNAKLCLWLTWEGSIGHAEATNDLVSEINRRTAAFADREVYSPVRMIWLDDYFGGQASKSLSETAA